MHNVSLLIGCLLMVLTALGQHREQPNIVVFFVDDLGWQDVSVPFYKETTPF